MNLYKNQRLNQVLRKSKHFLLLMRHPSLCPYAVLRNNKYSWQKYHDKEFYNFSIHDDFAL